MRDSLRVLQIVSACHPGGTERIVSSLSRNLVTDGWAVDVVCPGIGWLTESLRDSGACVSTKPLGGLRRYATIASLAVKLREKPVDIIHAHLHRAARAAFVVSRLTGIPVVTTVHAARPNPIYKRLATGANRILAVSDYVRSLLLEWGVPASHIDVVYNGTDFDQKPVADRNEVLAELGIPSERQVIGFIGRIQPAKGCFELIDSLADLLGRGVPAHLVLVGPVDSMDAAAYVASKGLSDHVTFAGVRFDVARMIDAFDILALPSHRETFGVAALEAMARGKAVVASRVGGLPEVVIDGETGILVAPGAEPLANTMGHLLAHPLEAEAMGRRGLEVARSRFSLESMILRHQQIYSSVIETTAVIPTPREATVR